MSQTIPGDILIYIAFIILASLPMPRLPNPFAARRRAHLARVKARAVERDAALQKQAELDTILARVYARADYETRMARIETAPADADLEEFFYASL